MEDKLAEVINSLGAEGVDAFYFYVIAKFYAYIIIDIFFFHFSPSFFPGLSPE